MANSGCTRLKLSIELRGFTQYKEFLSYIAKVHADIVFLDICMGEHNGLEAARILRNFNQTCTVIFVTSSRDYAIDAFAVMAAHYLVKPVDLRELAAVLTAVLRRAWGGGELPGVRPSAATNEVWRVDVAERALVAPLDAWRLRLTQSECAMLVHLLDKAGEAVSRQEILAAIDPLIDCEQDQHRVDMILSRLRRKADAAGVELPIRSVRGHGYRFAASKGDD